MSKNYRKKSEYFLYALILNGVPVYVGCTDNFIRRKIQHRKTKKFDYGIIIKRFQKKEDALLAENAIIRFMSLYSKETYLNSRSLDMVFLKEFMDCGYPIKKESEV